MIEERFVTAGSLTFHVLEAGPPDGDLVVLLHGFPELAQSWKHQLTALAAAGFRAVAPDQRGYGRTTIAGPYDVHTLAADVAALIGALGRSQAFVVGHDWGGGVAWTFASSYPQLLQGLAVANCPPPSVLAKALTSSPTQLLKSWYMLFFQLPWLPEFLLTRNDSWLVARALAGGTYVPGTFGTAELAQYRTAFSRPGSATAAVNWYRAALRHPRELRGAPPSPISAPVLVLWGVHDSFLGRELVDPNRLASVLAEGNLAEIELFADAGHFVQNEVPDEFNAALCKWLARIG